MRRCNGRLFDGSACNNLLLQCPDCSGPGCVGDGCDQQVFTSASACDCGTPLAPAGQAVAA
jgi:hypothetical protein